MNNIEQGNSSGFCCVTLTPPEEEEEDSGCMEKSCALSMFSAFTLMTAKSTCCAGPLLAAVCCIGTQILGDNGESAIIEPE